VNTDKTKTLIESGSFNRNADSVRSPMFRSNPYFDPQDLVQVKYEMLRAVKTDELNVSDASQQFGFSRTAYYKIEKRFYDAGVDGLCAQKTGPKLPSKITPDIIEFVAQLKGDEPGIINDNIVERIREEKGVSIHKRSLQRVQAKKKHHR